MILRLRSLLVVAFAALGLCARASAAEFPDGLYGHESVAAVEGAGALLVNPAALSTRYPSELLLGIGEAGERLRSGMAIGAAGPLALGWSEVEHGPRDLRLGIAAGDRARLGWSVDRRREGGEDRTEHRLGMLLRASPSLSLGATLDRIGEARAQGGRLPRHWVLGLALRPLALARAQAHAVGPRLTLSGDVLLEEDAPRSAARVRVGAEAEILPGLALRGSVEDHGSYRLGVGLFGSRTAYHGHAAFGRDGDRRSSAHALSFHSAEDRTALARGRGRIAEIRAGGRLGDEDLSGLSLFGGGGTTRSAALHHQLERARKDPLTRGVLLELRGVSGMAQLEELKPRIARLRAAGKPVVAFLEYGGGRGDLYLASGCDRVVATEEAGFAALGLRVERRYWRRLLDQWGVRIDRSSVGPYKSAFRTFSVDSTPPRDREAIESHLDLQQELFVDAVAGERRMDRGRLLGLLDGRWWPPVELQRAGLLDSVGYREDALRILGGLTRLGSKPRGVNLARVPEARRAWAVPRRIAVVYASGSIEIGRSGTEILNGDYMGSETVTRQLERAFRDREVEAVVLRVESPGGSSLASNLIHHAARRLKREHDKPLIVSMGGVAASGGYYISLAGDRLFADRFTRTGSIGVLFVKPSLEGWYEKHQVRQDEFERGPHMGAWSLGRDWTARWQAAADSAVRSTYSVFLRKVAEDRKLPWEQVEAAAGGRVWLGQEALERRLVDEIGGLEEALAHARLRAGIPATEEIGLLELRRPRPSLLSRLGTLAAREALGLPARLPEPGAIDLRADVEDD